MNKLILYIGNDLNQKTNYKTSIQILSALLISEGYNLITKSSYLNKGLRLLDMIISVIKFRNKTKFILIDTFSTRNFYFALVVAKLARFFKIKYIPILRGGNLPERLIKSKSMSNFMFKNSYVNIAPSLYLKDSFTRSGFQTVLIPNTIDITNYKFTNRSSLQPKLLYVRAFAKIYNPTLAIKVLKEVQKKYPNAKLCMIGPDRDGTLKEVNSLIDKYHLNDSVEITGALSKEEWHKKSEEFDVFINTTNIDNTPVSVIEAMALGLPIVSTNVGGIPFLIKNNENGILVEKNNVTEMTKAIFNLIENDSNSIILKARKTAESFSWENVKQEWVKILK